MTEEQWWETCVPQEAVCTEDNKEEEESADYGLPVPLLEEEAAVFADWLKDQGYEEEGEGLLLLIRTKQTVYTYISWDDAWAFYLADGSKGDPAPHDVPGQIFKKLAHSIGYTVVRYPSARKAYRDLLQATVLALKEDREALKDVLYSGKTVRTSVRT